MPFVPGFYFHFLTTHNNIFSVFYFSKLYYHVHYQTIILSPHLNYQAFHFFLDYESFFMIPFYPLLPFPMFSICLSSSFYPSCVFLSIHSAPLYPGSTFPRDLFPSSILPFHPSPTVSLPFHFLEQLLLHNAFSSTFNLSLYPPFFFILVAFLSNPVIIPYIAFTLLSFISIFSSLSLFLFFLYSHILNPYKQKQ